MKIQIFNFKASQDIPLEQESWDTWYRKEISL